MTTITEKVKDYFHAGKELALATLIVGSSIYVAEKTGITQSLVEYDKIVSEIYTRAHEQAPWLVWAAPMQRPDIVRHVGRDIDLGLTSLIIAGAGIALYRKKEE